MLCRLSGRVPCLATPRQQLRPTGLVSARPAAAARHPPPVPAATRHPPPASRLPRPFPPLPTACPAACPTAPPDARRPPLPPPPRLCMTGGGRSVTGQAAAGRVADKRSDRAIVAPKTLVCAVVELAHTGGGSLAAECLRLHKFLRLRICAMWCCGNFYQPAVQDITKLGSNTPHLLVQALHANCTLHPTV
ncbi:hypothetical protein GGX14DRAFT_566607 [Mycena pura]|uniref:Uncharacterized protein n=1 Tax=Mycena pura TaxID=153505 RepID=A0AAD6YEG9_9AGAR|nr:hypothetical protein GGX14DRAFT_566607 [Mycena pura]